MRKKLQKPAAGEVFSGQDAADEGVQMSFTDNGDGNVTGLIWEQDPTDTAAV